MFFDLILSAAAEALGKRIRDLPFLEGEINAGVINNIVNACRHRPHPLSTFSDYTCWTSLTDQTYSARHVEPVYLPNLKDPAVLKDFFKHDDDGGDRPECPKSTCLFPAFAQYLTDGFIRTKMEKSGGPNTIRRQNTSNHQIDLCPLYGRTPEQTYLLRTNSEDTSKKGRLRSQFIGEEEFPPFLFEDNILKAEFENLDFPLGLKSPGDAGYSEIDERNRRTIFAVGGDRVNSAPHVSMINTLFLREHNRICAILEEEPESSSWDDERIFQTARNCVIVLFIKIVVEEYINHINYSPFRLRADPRVAWNAPWNKPNWITCEFSLLYRWHSLIPDTLPWNGEEIPVNPEKYFFNNEPLILAGLNRAFTDLSRKPACKLGAFNTVSSLLGVEQRALEQGRIYNLAPYTRYREYMGMSQPKYFSDISSNPKVVEFLAKHYTSVKEVDYYIGLFAEDTPKNTPLPPLMMAMVAVDAFSQALTNPLLSEHVYHAGTFSKVGWRIIHETSSLEDVLERNVSGDIDRDVIGMTRPDWRYSL